MFQSDTTEILCDQESKIECEGEDDDNSSNLNNKGNGETIEANTIYDT